MAFTPYDSCKVCQSIRAEADKSGRTKNSTLLKRIYGSKAYDKRGEPMKYIAEAYAGKFTYQGLMNHVKKHQALSEKQLSDRRLKSMAQEQEKFIADETVREIFNHNSARDLIIQKGAEGIMNGSVAINASALVSATKQASDIEERSKDRQFEVLKMIGAFAAGEIVKESLDEPAKVGFGITAEATVDNIPGA